MFACPVLLGDIGGTNARFALLPEPGGAIEYLPKALTAATPTPVEAIAASLASSRLPPPRSAILAVANRVDGLAVRLTNADWIVDAAAIGRAFGLGRVALVNDYPPVAASVVALDSSRGELVPLGDPRPGHPGARVVLGPGTGLGAAALIPVEGRLALVATEGGHVDFGPAGPEEAAFWPHLPLLDGRISAEAVLSGPGLLRLATALARAKGRGASPFREPHEVYEAGHDRSDPLAAETLQTFARLLGRYAGDLALLFEASAGVFIAGGIAPRMIDILSADGFREAFDRKAPHDGWMRTVPTAVIVHQEPALQGLAVLASDPGRFVYRSEEWRGS